MLVCLSLKSCFLSLFKEAPVFEPSSEVWNKHIIFPVHLGQIILHSRFTLDRSYYIPGSSTSPRIDHIIFLVDQQTLGQIWSTPPCLLFLADLHSLSCLSWLCMFVYYVFLFFMSLPKGINIPCFTMSSRERQVIIKSKIRYKVILLLWLTWQRLHSIGFIRLALHQSYCLVSRTVLNEQYDSRILSKMTVRINSLLLYTIDVLVTEGYNLLEYYLLYNA